MNLRERLQALLDGKDVTVGVGGQCGVVKYNAQIDRLRDGDDNHPSELLRARFLDSGVECGVQPRLGTFMEAVEHADRDGIGGGSVKSVVTGRHFDVECDCNHFSSVGDGNPPTPAEIRGQWELL